MATNRNNRPGNTPRDARTDEIKAANRRARRAAKASTSFEY